jgi:hypothetical protein
LKTRKRSIANSKAVQTISNYCLPAIPILNLNVIGLC